MKIFWKADAKKMLQSLIALLGFCDRGGEAIFR